LQIQGVVSRRCTPATAEVNGAKGNIVETPRCESLSGSPRAILIYACAAAIRVRSGTTFLVPPSMIVRR
jgi:hypothetical protein